MAEFICTDDVCCLDDETEILPFNSHEGVNLPMVGGHVKLDDPSVDPMLVAAAYDQTNVVFVFGDVAYLVPMSGIDTDMVELACNERGCALIPNDFDESNDVALELIKLCTTNHVLDD